MRLQITPSQSCDVKKDIDVEADDVNSLLVAVGLAISVKVVEILIYDDDFEEWILPENISEVEEGIKIQVKVDSSRRQK